MWKEMSYSRYTFGAEVQMPEVWDDDYCADYWNGMNDENEYDVEE